MDRKERQVLYRYMDRRTGLLFGFQSDGFQSIALNYISTAVAFFGIGTLVEERWRFLLIGIGVILVIVGIQYYFLLPRNLLSGKNVRYVHQHTSEEKLRLNFMRDAVAWISIGTTINLFAIGCALLAFGVERLAKVPPLGALLLAVAVIVLLICWLPIRSGRRRVDIADNIYEGTGGTLREEEEAVARFLGIRRG